MSQRISGSLLGVLTTAAMIGGPLGCGGSNGLPPSSQFAQICTSVDPQRRWVRSYMNEAYLWYSEIPVIDASGYPTPTAYFNALLVRKPTASGQPRDRFSFTYPTDAFDNLINSGVEAGYGIEWAIVPNTRIVRVAYTEPGSPAAVAEVKRGATVLRVNDNDINTMPRDPLVAALYPSDLGIQTRLTLSEVNPQRVHEVTLTSANVTKTPVPTAQVLTTATGRIGYLVFNDHLATAEDPLMQAIGQFKAAGIDSLILDLRYNGGGYLYIANELASMIGGDPVVGQVFEKLQYNDKRSSQTNASVMRFVRTSYTSHQTLPTLGLPRVLVLTYGGTCSASESVINGLSPFLDVVRIGGTTCGKPYGFTAKDNCGTSYFPIEFQGTNAAGFGDYADGFAPNCTVSDDLAHELGDPNEAMLAAALAYQATGSCPAGHQLAPDPWAQPAQLYRSPARENRILTE